MSNVLTTKAMTGGSNATQHFCLGSRACPNDLVQRRSPLSLSEGLSQRPCITGYTLVSYMYTLYYIYTFVLVLGLVPTTLFNGVRLCLGPRGCPNGRDIFIYIYIYRVKHAYIFTLYYIYMNCPFLLHHLFSNPIYPPHRPHGVIVINPNGITCFICVYDIANT